MSLLMTDIIAYRVDGKVIEIGIRIAISHTISDMEEVETTIPSKHNPIQAQSHLLK